MRFTSHHAHPSRSPRIVITPQEKESSRVSIELLNMNDESSASYSLTLIGVGGSFEIGAPQGGVVSSRCSSCFQMEGSIEELNRFLRKTAFSPKSESETLSWVTVHIEKVGTSDPIVDRSWREFSLLEKRSTLIEKTLSQSLENVSSTVPLTPASAESFAE